MKKNVAGQKIGAQLVSATDGSAFTGAVTVYVTVDAGAQGAGSVGAGACTHEGQGYHTYAPADAETNGDLLAFTFVGSGAVPATVQVFTGYPQTGDSYVRLGAPAGASVSADILTLDNLVDDLESRLGTPSDLGSGATVAANLVDIEGQTDDIGAAGAGLTAITGAKLHATQGAITWGQQKIIAAVASEGALHIANSDAGGIGTYSGGGAAGDYNKALDNAGYGQWNEGGQYGQINYSTVVGSSGQFNQGATADINGDQTGNLSGSVGSVTGAVGSVTGAVGSVTGAVGSVTGNVGGNVTGSVGSVAAGGITAASIATGAVDADALAADASAEIADAVWDEVLAGHAGAGSAGAALSAAGGAADPLLNAVPGAYAAGTAGNALGSIDDIKAKTDLITTGTALTVVSPIDGSTITATIGATLAATISGLTISATWTKVYLTVKQRAADADAASILQVVVSNPAAAATDGALYVLKTAATVAQRTLAALTVTQAAGTVAIALDEVLTGALREYNGLAYDLKEITTAGAANVLCAGTWNLVYTPTWAVA